MEGGPDQQEEEILWPSYCNPNYVMPDEIEVKVAGSAGDYYFPVSVTKSSGPKTYFGGYRDKVTGKLYHHANSQTPTERKHVIKDTSNLRSRETQTYEYRTLSVQSYREFGTQMERIDVSIDTKNDVEKESRLYFTADALLEVKKANTITIQRTWRGYTARCLAARQHQKNIDHQIGEEEERAAKAQEAKEKRAEDMQRRLHPSKKKDFSILYNELDVWRKTETQKIKATTGPGEDRRKLMANLLANETKALQSIQNLKTAATKDEHAEKTQKMLKLMSAPHRWQMSTGDITYVQTPATVRSTELLNLFNALRDPHIASVDQRLEVLYLLKSTVNVYQGHLIHDITDLIDRESDLLNRGRPIATMESLRTRLCNQFLQFIENPLYNPRAEQFVNLPMRLSTALPEPPETAQFV